MKGNPLYLFSDEHGIAIFTDDICQRTVLVMDRSCKAEFNFHLEDEETYGNKVNKSLKVK